ncbi:putative ran binding protein in the microtubule-organising centre [Rosellinia necatrix]|uniref:Putative ran binding protein in the microtubule-organising centre n=1 Tax=Rosellinia necatrix TaxID=77044 RepID=A0A1W2TD56_ROSNE|nr:putative ran binding protein in the microtubule-organising centre [Rosellinia necatrix]
MTLTFSSSQQTSSSTSTATPVRHPFTRQVEEVKTPKSDINALILDYLTVAGYPNAAAKFSSEANLQPQQPTSAIQQRLRIQKFIHMGEIENAIQELNEVYPSILDNDDSLLFALLRLQLVELIRNCNSSPDRDISAALKFAQTKLGPKATVKQEFLEDLEKTMSLLVFPQDDSLDSSLSALLQPSLRRDVADQVNQAILEYQHQRKETAIRQLVQMRVWSEEVARKDCKKDLPAVIELGLDNDDADIHDPIQNGHEPMITT